MTKTKTFVVSDETVNSHGFTVLTAGIDLSRFEKNPVMLFNHDTANIIGRWENIRVEGVQLLADAVFDETDEQGKEIARKVAEGFLKATSLGLNFSENDLKEGKLEKSVLHEISIVNIGANENAVKLYDNSKNINLHFENLSLLNELKQLSVNGTDLLLAITSNDKSKLSYAVNNINLKFENLKEFKAKADKFNEQESEFYLKMAVDRKVLPKHMIDIQREQFKLDFYKTKETLQTAIYQSLPHKDFSYVKHIEEARLRQNSKGKNKANWTLEDYRVNAPKELQANPELYKRLYDESTSK